MRRSLCVSAFAVAVAACAPAVRSQSPGDPHLPELVRRVAPFEFQDSTGHAYDHPFLGGFNVPRPQLVDIDRDGDLDLFVQEAPGEILLFERLAGTDPSFAWKTDRFADLDVGEWYRFADLDDDGDPDLLGERRLSLIRAWENRGPGAEPMFAGIADTLLDTEGRPIYSDRQNIPNVIDFDCDGLLDLMLGRLDGSVTRYEATAPWTGSGAPTFAFVTDRFAGIRIVAQITPSARHGANTLVFADGDGDSDRDLFWGDFFEPGLLLLRNEGTCAEPSFSNVPIPWPVGDPISTSGYNASTFGDVDGDGDLDAIVGVLGGAYNPVRTSAENLYIMLNDADGWRLVTRQLIGQVDVGAESVPAIGDLDGDGDPDLLLGNKIDPRDHRSGRIYRFENTGAQGRPGFRLVGALPMSGDFHYAPALGDFDQDGDLDLVVGTWNRGIQLWRNEGTSREARWVGPDSLLDLPRGSHATPALEDLDGDGDLDLLAGESSGEVNLWRNDGTPRAPLWTLVTDSLAGLDVGRRSAPAMVDLDGDGDLDIVVGAEDGPAAVLWNQGDLEFSRDARTIALPGLSAPAFVDLDRDGDPDLLLGEIAGGLRYYENTTRVPR
ncbi:MAG: FG-GAP repeat domain-containing protein [Gemmatimonadota bacterium]